MTFNLRGVFDEAFGSFVSLLLFSGCYIVPVKRNNRSPDESLHGKVASEIPLYRDLRGFY